MNYTEDSLVPAMQHIAKNVLKVNEGQTKHMVRRGTALLVNAIYLVYN